MIFFFLKTYKYLQKEIPSSTISASHRAETEQKRVQAREFPVSMARKSATSSAA